LTKLILLDSLLQEILNPATLNMVLLVNNRFLPVSPTNLAEFYNQNPRILQGAKDLAEKKPLRLEPTGILYVRQKQWAATHPGDQLDDGQVGARGDCYDSQLAE